MLAGFSMFMRSSPKNITYETVADAFSNATVSVMDISLQDKITQVGILSDEYEPIFDEISAIVDLVSDDETKIIVLTVPIELASIWASECLDKGREMSSKVIQQIGARL